MIDVTLDLKQWGNNVGVRLPAAIVREADLQVHQSVNITVINGQVVISPVKNKPLSLEERLALFDPQQHGGEVMTTLQQLGAEQW